MKHVFYSLLSFTLLFSNGARSEEALSPFAVDVTTHVLLHELGHAIFREFDVPVLTNEEAMADTFATFYATQYMRERAPQVIVSRAKSWIFEDSEVNPVNYDHKGEHQLDIRRAYQALCLFYGADPAEFGHAITFAGFSEGDLADCSDTAPDQFEAWDTVISNLPKADQGVSGMVRVIYGEGPMKDTFIAAGVMEEIAQIARQFAWPDAPITLHFDHCSRGASWSRSKRRILLCDGYVERFVKQGELIQ